MTAVEEAYGKTFAPVAVEVMAPEMPRVEESVAALVRASVPCKTEFPVVVAPPEMVRPVVAPPAPMVEEAVDMMPP